MKNYFKRFTALALAMFMASCGGSSGDSGAADVIPPTVNFTNPIKGSTGIAPNQKITATFSEALTASTINQTTFTLQDTTDGVAVVGTVTYDGQNRIATFSPTTTLAASHAFSVTLTTDVKDLAGNAMLAEKV